MDFEAAAGELYRLTPAEFTEARNAKASEARAAGERQLASQLRELRKPSVGAWLANLLTVEQPDQVDELADLGARLRSSADELDGERIRTASREKHDVISKLLSEAKSSASRKGQPVSEAALRDLEATLDAAFADADAARALRRGQLTTGLQYSGLGLVAGSSAPRTTTRRSDSKAREAERELKEARRLTEQADARLAKATRAVAQATAELARCKSSASEATREATEAHKRLAAAERRV
jgi:hypothetical protein